MAEEKRSSTELQHDADLEKSKHVGSVDSASGEEVVRPEGWLYKTPKIGPIHLTYVASPLFQLCIVAFVCFLCPGIFNALSGLGGGGQIDATTSNNSAVALYSTFATVAFASGTICNKIGFRWTLGLGGLGYSLYIASFISYNHNANSGFVIASGAILGVCAGLLWCAQGAVMMSYPLEKEKGRFVGIFWSIFNMGAVIGALVPLAQNLHNSSGTVSDGTYIGLFILTVLGACLAFTLLNSDKVIRKDGSRIIAMHQPTWTSEIKGLVEVLRTDTFIIALFPMFFASNWFYSYQFNDVNLAQFNTRTRSLNSLLYWTMQIVGAGTFGLFLDQPWLNRRGRAIAGWVVVMLLTLAIWGGGLAFQLGYHRLPDTTDKTVQAQREAAKMDWTSPGYGGPFVLYLFYGFFDAVWQTYAYWIMGAISNNSRKLAFYAGFYKGIQSAGSAVMFRLDALKLPYINLFASCWALLLGGLLFAAPIILWKVENTTDVEKDKEFSDEK